MADRISILPDMVLSHILSFLPTKEAVMTSALSKRWYPLWLSVLTLNFDDYDYTLDLEKETYFNFVRLVYACILSRKLHQPIQTFILRCHSLYCDDADINMWLNAVTQRRVEHLDLHFPRFIDLPTSVLNCKTLVVLKLRYLFVKNSPSVDLPSLKILHLKDIEFSEYRKFAELLFRCPNLEELVARNLNFNKFQIEGFLFTLPKLVRADIGKVDVPLLMVTNVKFLRIDWIDEEAEEVHYQEQKSDNRAPLITEFYNLTHIEFGYFDYVKDWPEILQVLSFCPKLQILVVDKMNLRFPPHADERVVWSYPNSVPACISLHLKRCCLNNYKGSEGELQFARYILENATLLRTMTICSNMNMNDRKRLLMLKKLSSYARRSSSCTLLFK